MTLLEIFEKVNLVVPLEQRRFFNYLSDTVAELHSLYGKFVFVKDREYTTPEALTDEFNVLPLYCPAIADNIIFSATQNEVYKSEFLRKSNDAFLKYWNDNAKGKRIKRMRW